MRSSMLAAAGFVFLYAPSAAAQAPPGRLEEQVRSVTDTSQTFALYYPPGYSTERRWPVLFVLDPRGRALLALNLFQDRAARLGWVILSSYNTLSDGPPEPNVDAVNAMLAWAQAHPSLDPSRVYLAGFSGTARAALGFAVALRGHVAGVIAVGGALGFAMGGPETAFAADSTFAYFGSAGTQDFNYEEVFAMADRFRTTRVPFRVVAFDGPHGWPPPDMCGDALDWLELRAMLGGLRAMDSGWVGARLAGELARAAELERLGLWADALRLDEAIGRDYARWPEAKEATDRAPALRRSPVLAKYEAEVRRLARVHVNLAFYEPRAYLATAHPVARCGCSRRQRPSARFRATPACSFGKRSLLRPRINERAWRVSARPQAVSAGRFPTVLTLAGRRPSGMPRIRGRTTTAGTA